MRKPKSYDLIRLIVLAAVYFAAAKLGFELAFSTRQVTAIWAPTGIALAAMLLYGVRVWPAIAVGAFLANFSTGEGALPALAIALGNTLEATVGTYLLKNVLAVRTNFSRMRDVMSLFLVAPVATALSASIGTSVLAQAGIIEWSAYNSTWLTWWVGDLHGALIFTPIITVFMTMPRLPAWMRRRRTEAGLLLAATVALSLGIFFRDATPSLLESLAGYLIYPIILWAALRFMQPGALLAALIVTATAVWGTVVGLGPFAVGTSVDMNLIKLQFFLFVLGATALIVSTVSFERQRTVEALRRSAQEMEALLQQNREMSEQLREANKRATGILTRILDESIEALPLEDKRV